MKKKFHTAKLLRAATSKALLPRKRDKAGIDIRKMSPTDWYPIKDWRG
jgi:hypothetical protein